MEIEGKSAVITGGASGIGRATARRLAAEGAAVMIVDLNTDLAAETVDEIQRAGGRVNFMKADVTDPAQMSEVFNATLARFGRFDILHNNAGIAVPIPGYPRVPIEVWRRVIEVDRIAVALGCHLAYPLMKERGGGVIINTASMAGIYPIAMDPIYAAAKAGVVQLTQSLTRWRKRNIRVNCVCPGVVETPMVLQASERREEAGVGAIAPKTILKPEDIADVVVMLIKDDSLLAKVVEVRPSGTRFVDARRTPRAS